MKNNVLTFREKLLAFTVGALFAALVCARSDGQGWPVNDFLSTTNYIGVPWAKEIIIPAKTLEVYPVSEPCPECHGLNHHEVHVDRMMSYAEEYLPVKTAFGTNQVLLRCSRTNYFVATNIVFRVQTRQQPGWTNRPGPAPLP